MNEQAGSTYRQSRWFNAQRHDYTIGHGLTHISKFAPGGGFVLPPFQRGLVWTTEQDIRFIESIFGGLPIGTYVYNQSEDIDGPYSYWLLDGQQRWNAIKRFVRGEFDVLGRNYLSFSAADVRRFDLEAFPAYVTRLDDPVQLEDIFERLAYGGTANVRPASIVTVPDNYCPGHTGEVGP